MSNTSALGSSWETKRSFRYQASPTAVYFGPGESRQLAQRLKELAIERALLLASPRQAAALRAASPELGEKLAGTFTGAQLHTPVSVTAEALRVTQEVNADAIVAVGGGSAVGLSKAIALRTGLPQVVLPTTYAGSEVTPILGQTENGLKTTLRDPAIVPQLVIYDPELTSTLPTDLSVSSGLNAIAHAVEALYAPDANPISTLTAGESLHALHDALPALVADPSDGDARARALYGSWLAGTVLGQVAMSLHHKICHTLGGTFDLPHAEVHSIMLPHTVAFNSHAAEAELAPVTELFGAPAGAGLFDFATALGAPRALADLGVAERDLDRAAALATQNPYANPRPVDRDAVRALLEDAWRGNRPSA